MPDTAVKNECARRNPKSNLHSWQWGTQRAQISISRQQKSSEAFPGKTISWGAPWVHHSLPGFTELSQLSHCFGGENGCHTLAFKKGKRWIWESNWELLKWQSDFIFFSVVNHTASYKRTLKSLVSAPWDRVELDDFCGCALPLLLRCHPKAFPCWLRAAHTELCTGARWAHSWGFC